MARLRGRILIRWLRVHAPAGGMALATSVVVQYAQTYTGKVPYHTGVLSGGVPELLQRHPPCIRIELGIFKEVLRVWKSSGDTLRKAHTRDHSLDHRGSQVVTFRNGV